MFFLSLGKNTKGEMKREKTRTTTTCLFIIIIKLQYGERDEERGEEREALKA